jgi:hypothetical protein
MKPDFVFVPSSNSDIWVIYPYFSLTNILREESIDIDSGKLKFDSYLTDLVKNIMDRIENTEKISILFGESKNVNILTIDQAFIVSACVSQCYFKISQEESIKYISNLFKISKLLDKSLDVLQIARYRRPLTVIFAGDRDSAICFEESITQELKSLPKYSIVIHGGCRGIDLYVEDLCKLYKVETCIFKIDEEKWKKFGKAAGPLRNKEMLDFTHIDMIVAFHPDIMMSKGTKNMMKQAYDRGIPVFLHDLKRKEKFEGDFTKM